ncbi:MAG: DUF6089 family protein [Crocinitomicaceae bacterium]|jgi:hypothetical protein|nr:DUF6089 family protein [Crocinitomicaceae bacterium]MDG1658607.1 DUF6089 family protein [Crocinitomicaceae bacterium]MDG2440874.1 DUF6089 family protein [Crocinitomicaceae bacterium]
MTRILVIFILVCLPAGLFAQRQTKKSRSELGVLVGGSYYIGDLNRFGHFKNTQLAGGIMYRFNIHSRAAFRSTFSYMRVKSDDADAKSEQQQDRGLSFKSHIWEFANGVEFNYFPFQVGHKRYKGTMFLFAEVAVFRINPKTEYEGGDIALQPLGTEGQGTSLNNKSKYGLFQVAIPFGFGGRVSLGSRACLGMEFGVRKTFTDYIDDVKAGSYSDYDVLLAENGPIAAELSNRSDSRFGQRGNSATKDWYFFTGASLTFTLGKPTSCPPR